jgi:hypothetical protein
LAKSNCIALVVNFINTYSKGQQDEFADKNPQGTPPLEDCTWYKDIIYFMQELRPLMVWEKERQDI